jgi:hypothetical protein
VDLARNYTLCRHTTPTLIKIRTIFCGLIFECFPYAAAETISAKCIWRQGDFTRGPEDSIQLWIRLLYFYGGPRTRGPRTSGHEPSEPAGTNNLLLKQQNFFKLVANDVVLVCHNHRLSLFLVRDLARSSLSSGRCSYTNMQNAIQ